MKPDDQASSKILIKNGTVVNDDSIFTADLLLENGIIKEIGQNLNPPTDVQRIIDARGKYVMPGGIDPHTHFHMPFFGTHSVDDFFSGTQAALAGGTTMIIDFITSFKDESLLANYEKYREWADPNACCNYAFSSIVPQMNEKIKREMQELVQNKGINSFKFFMAYPGMLQIKDDELYEGFVQCKKLGALARVHAENGDLIAIKQKDLLCQGITGPEGHLQAHPEEGAAEATHRACLLANEANCPLYVVHVMSEGCLDAIEQARRRGTVVFGEAVGSALAGVDGRHLFDACWQHAAAHVMSPPLSCHPEHTQRRLMTSLGNNQLQTTGSDHATFDSKQKAVGKNDFTKIPNGVNGVEERMMIVWNHGLMNTGTLDPMRFVAITSTNAAKLFHIYPKKGKIALNSDADLVIWDPELTRVISVKNHQSKCDFNIFENTPCHGSPWITICNGKVAYESGKVVAPAGSGKFVPLAPFSPSTFGALKIREKLRQPIKIDRSGGLMTTANGGGLPNTSSSSRTHTAMALHDILSSMTVGVVEPYHKSVGQESMVGSDTARRSTTVVDGCAIGGDFHQRGVTKGGGRNMQDSSFALSGDQIDDNQPTRRATKISKPPGGESRGLW